MEMQREDPAEYGGWSTRRRLNTRRIQSVPEDMIKLLRLCTRWSYKRDPSVQIEYQGHLSSSIMVQRMDDEVGEGETIQTMSWAESNISVSGSAAVLHFLTVMSAL